MTNEKMQYNNGHRHKSKNNNHKIYIGIITTLLLAVGMFIALVIYSNTLQRSFQSEIISSLKESANQSVAILQNKIAGKIDLLMEISDRISTLPIKDYQKTVDGLDDTCARYHFKRMGIILPNGDAYSTDQQFMNLSDRSYFKNAMQGISSISDTLIDRIGGESINVYSTPIYEDNHIVGVLFATYASNDLRNLLTVPTFEGEGYLYLVNREGTCIIDSSHPKSYKNMKNLFDAMLTLDSNNKDEVATLREHLQKGQEGYIKFNNHGYRYMYYAPLGVNDWNVITVISADVLEKKMNQVMYKTYSLSASLLAIFIMTLGYILITQRKNRQIIMDIAYVDPLTGGYSYAKFQKEFPAVLADVTRKAAILNLDIDDFKFINDAFGYREGDNLIRYIWNILSTWVEKDELYAHQSADVFVALVFYEEEEKLRERLDDLCEQLQHYYIRHNNKVRIVPAIGIHEIMNKTQSQDSFIDAARLARKTVKGKMDIFYAFYDEAIKESIYHDKEIEATMQDALNNHEFIVYYQPKYNADTQQIEGAEALVRWQKKDGTLVPPNDFIPLFERNGFITAVDSYVFKSVCRFQRSLMDQGITPVPISVNLSRMHIYDLDFIEKYTTYMEQLQIPISYIQLEITESAISDNQALLLDVLNRLHQLGFLILLDDFGTGYSSMLMLKNLSIDVLKIDKSFVDNIGDHRGNKIIDGIISLSQSLDISITAEGVEQQSQYEYLKMRGCNHIQGYYFAKPMAEAAFKKLL